MHGVGGDVVLQALQRAGFPAPRVVAAQFAPDPTSPPSRSPTRRSRARWTSRSRRRLESDADVVVANDPDADRCAAAVPTRDRGSSGGPAYRMLRGDEVGWLLGWWLHERGCAVGSYANSIVSSSLLARMASATAWPHHETLTGFKWIAAGPRPRVRLRGGARLLRRPGARRRQGRRLRAALLIARWSPQLSAQGRTVHDVLDALAVEHGLHATDQLSVRVADVSVIAGAMARLRAAPPTEVAGAPSSGSRTSRTGSTGCRPPTACGFAWPRAPA
jgi:phosphomannomutase